MTTAAEVTALRLELVDGGWNPIPVVPSTKRPQLRGWSEVDANPFHIESWEKSRPTEVSTGLVCNRDYVAIDLDVASDTALARVVLAVALKVFGYTPFIRVGRAPKLLLVYRQTRGSINSTRRIAASANGDGVEVLSTGRQFVAFGVHPDTGEPYQWIGEANPREDMPADAPLITQTQVDAFIAAVHEIMPLGAPGRKVSEGGVGDQPRAYSAEGLVIDGRENLLRDCVLQAAREMWNGNEPLEARAVAARGWELFTQRASLDDGKWSFDAALAKARATVRRVRDGRLKLEKEIAKTAKLFFNEDVSANVKNIRKLLVDGLEHFQTYIWQEMVTHAFA